VFWASRNCGSLNSVGDVDLLIWQTLCGAVFAAIQGWLEITVCATAMTMTKPADSWLHAQTTVFVGGGKHKPQHLWQQEVSAYALLSCSQNEWEHYLWFSPAPEWNCLSEVCARGPSEISEAKGTSLLCAPAVFLSHTHAHKCVADWITYAWRFFLG